MATEIKYLRAIWGLARKAGLSEEELRDCVEAAAGVRSTRELRTGQALSVIDRLKKLSGDPPTPEKKTRRGYDPKRKKVKEKDPVRLISPKQRLLIEWFLCERLNLNGKDPDFYLQTMCGRLFHRPRVATSREAGLVIGNLRRLAESQAKQGKIPPYVEPPSDLR